ncbi:hypothetical protein [Pseudonocardia sp. TRM90224]|uniref:hypothetical protein n=1 Tax=Pseudonocardia sp. TRM90224 TaxID=2812678 RepID=UPI001E38FDF4|nr:hypothetical protein [Pseudonocardia sp. TRM90224]
MPSRFELVECDSNIAQSGDQIVCASPIQRAATIGDQHSEIRHTARRHRPTRYQPAVRPARPSTRKLAHRFANLHGPAGVQVGKTVGNFGGWAAARPDLPTVWALARSAAAQVHKTVGKFDGLWRGGAVLRRVSGRWLCAVEHVRGGGAQLRELRGGTPNRDEHVDRSQQVSQGDPVLVDRRIRFELLQQPCEFSNDHLAQLRRPGGLAQAQCAARESSMTRPTSAGDCPSTRVVIRPASSYAPSSNDDSPSQAKRSAITRAAAASTTPSAQSREPAIAYGADPRAAMRASAAVETLVAAWIISRR